MRRAIGRMGLALLAIHVSAALAQGLPSVDCSARYPDGAFALAEGDALRLTGLPRGFELVRVRRKPLLMPVEGAEDPCELVYGADVFELAGAGTPSSLVAGCAGDFRGRGARDYALLLRRIADARYVLHVFLARGTAFDLVTIEPHPPDDPAWFGPSCAPRPRDGVFQAPDVEGTGKPARVSVVGDLITVGWWTYYWRPELGRFEEILTSD